ncbi:MAG: hypothetical protein AAF193_00055 [Bacteroidota bacterium]
MDTQIPIEKYLMFTSPNSFKERILSVSSKIGLSQKTVGRIINKAEEISEVPLEEMAVSHFGPKSRIKDALILHDIIDKEITIDQSRTVAEAWDACVLEEITGTGHFKILKSPEVLDRALQFISGPSSL